MALKDICWQFDGVTNVTEDLTLESPKMMVKTVNYHTPDRTFTIEFIFTEGIYPHSRNYQAQLPEGDEAINAAMITALVGQIYPNAQLIQE